MGDVLVAFLAICISCAAALVAASYLWRALAALPTNMGREIADTVLGAARNGALQQFGTRARNWARTRRAWRPRAAHAARGAARKGLGLPAA